MLTADLVRARRYRGELRLSALDDKARSRATDLARAFLDISKERVGQTRSELESALDGVPVAARDRKLAAGIRKLVDDQCVFETEHDVAPRDLRREVFERAASARKSASEESPFDRTRALDEVAGAHGLSIEEVERLLYADLRDAQVLRSVADMGAEWLVSKYQVAQAQAVLLRATKVHAAVRCKSAGTYRALFRKLKFRRLMHSIYPLEGGGYRIDIDGPMSLFSSVTKYGLSLALVLPTLMECDEWAIEAELSWGKARDPLTFRLKGKREAGEATSSTERLPDDVATLVERLNKLDVPWEPTASTDILDLPGVGLCVPDLCFVHRETGEVVYLEVLGFWSRDAVWKRVELVEGGLEHHILFAISTRLRVSEAVLGDDLPGALYVYKGVMSAKAIAERLDAIASR